MTTAHFAKSKGLRYANPNEAGYRRQPRGGGFVYLDPRGKTVTSARLKERFRKLVIPPAWREVWICPHANGHLQVTGIDARGRKQYRYHEEWTRTRNEDKFKRLVEFGRVLPRIRARVERDLRKRSLSRAQVLAAVVKTMEQTGLRVGNDVYTRENGSYGLTTVRNRHVEIKGPRARFYFKGKSGVQRDVSLNDARLCRIIRNCRELPGAELFGYRDENGRAVDIDSKDVNDYLKEISGMDISAKDFRTWAGTLRALEILRDLPPPPRDTQTARRRREVDVIKQVAAHLGNTVSVCRKYYVDPRVFDGDRRGLLTKLEKRNARGLRACESQLIKLLAMRITKASAESPEARRTPPSGTSSR